MIKFRESLINITSIKSQKIRVNNENKLIITEKESIYLKNDVKLLDVYFVYSLNMNLLSINALLINK